MPYIPPNPSPEAVDAEASGYTFGWVWCLRCDVGLGFAEQVCWFCGKDDELHRRDLSRKTAFTRVEGAKA